MYQRIDWHRHRWQRLRTTSNKVAAACCCWAVHESLDATGYPEGPLARLLPVDLRPRAGQRSPAMGLVVVFDKSGSMADLVSGVAKIELARQAVRKVLDAVRPTDPIGVVAFDAAPVIVSPLAAAPDPQRQ